MFGEAKSAFKATSTKTDVTLCFLKLQKAQNYRIYRHLTKVFTRRAYNKKIPPSTIICQKNEQQKHTGLISI
ncbi:MAG TPA: hypothetical protein DCE42_07395 [Myxococcales bacterium]|nr:hypothetical protein [Deltaproteobacteria bacterium]MBU48599.1 hypothetical protein [Deltaproteobacteria bacterium]HAA54565.1 hypothetical protein [Myxococcales bacterium]|tara:strand:- start:17528 stop:17743 length:216 start_codon:yes stop_codon:yes gene_type:complete